MTVPPAKYEFQSVGEIVGGITVVVGDAVFGFRNIRLRNGSRIENMSVHSQFGIICATNVPIKPTKKINTNAKIRMIFQRVSAIIFFAKYF